MLAAEGQGKARFTKAGPQSLSDADPQHLQSFRHRDAGRGENSL
jgi:hypothetical protein